ncbi:putative Protein LSM14-like protein A [Hypsibius exemplaris]|uniref:Uncharacterized protein n=1 Tax=Hypsibius exemplaris TaxID=2072580 RepID=A0A1W0WB02_HYPEX|nr:putative Protein LSM14-like protein A [Hypsibius exemplaris]
MATSSGSAYIGCKISLVSKSDIRYEGILYTLDQVAATVALSNVRSFGTEERRPEAPIAGKDQIYDYILFRGSDIKDIVVCEPPRLDLFARRPEAQLADVDPAILSTTSNAASTQAGAVGAHLPRSLYSDSANARSSQPAHQTQRAHAGSRQQQEEADDHVADQHYGQRRRQDSQRYSDEDNYGSGGYRDYGSSSGGYGSSRGGGYGGYEQRDSVTYSSRGAGGYSAGGRGGRAGGQQGYGQGRGYGGDYVSRGGYQQSRGGYNNSRGYSRDDNGGQPRRQSNYQQSTGISSSTGHGPSSTPKETKDTLPEFDFENSAKVFHELEATTKKINLNDASVDGGKAEEPAQKPASYYNPDSFFDTISCEALEKEKHPGQRPDWKRERQVNSETFGQTGTGYRSRNFSGGHQGRGGYRNYNRDEGHQGGGGYRADNQQQRRGGYDNYDGNGYRPRGGQRYNGGGGGGYSDSRTFAPSNQRQAQNAGGGAYGGPEAYFRCPDSPQRPPRQNQPQQRQAIPRRRLLSPLPPPSNRRSGRAVRYADEEDWEDSRRYAASRDRPAGNRDGNTGGGKEIDGGRRRRNRNRGTARADGENVGDVQGPRQPSKTPEMRTKPPARPKQQQQKQLKQRNEAGNEQGGRRTGGGGRRAGDVTDGNAPGGAGGVKERRGRKTGEWVQYELPNNCKGLLPTPEKSSAEAAGGEGEKTNLMAFLDSPVVAMEKTTKPADWNGDAVKSSDAASRFTNSGDSGLTGDGGSPPQIQEVESH